MALLGGFGILVGIVMGVLALLSYWKQRKVMDGEEGRAPLPPSPWPSLPFLGHIAFLDSKRPYETITAWAKKLGPIMRLRFADQDLYVLSDYDVLKEAFTRHGDTFHGRPDIWLLSAMGDRKGLILADGSRWREQRRFSLHRLRDLGFGKSAIEAKIRGEVDVMLAELGKGGTSVDVVKEVSYAVANIITSVVYGYSFSRGDAQFERFQANMNESVRIIGIAGALMFFPWLRHIVPGGLGYPKLIASKKEVHAYHLAQIRKQAAHIKRGEDTGDSDNFVKAFLKEAAKGTGEYFDEEQLLIVVADLFFAGQETTVTTLRWALLFLCRQPEVQTRMREEMRSKLLRHAPTLGDRNSLPFCQAVVLEAQRRGNIIPLGVWHATTSEVELRGFRIPAGATVVPNLWAVMRDERRFPEPDAFKPERWLEADGSLTSKRDGLVPFSIGKRECLGESLALAELFLILTALVWNFELGFAEGEAEPTLEPVIGTTCSPQHFRFSLRPASISHS